MSFPYSLERKIIRYHLGSSHGIRATARRFGLPKTYVGRIIIKYKKSKGIR